MPKPRKPAGPRFERVDAPPPQRAPWTGRAPTGGAPPRAFEGTTDRGAPDGETIFGLRAGLAALERRASEVLAVALTRDAEPEAQRAARAADARGVAVREVSEHELARIAGSPHHEGLCVTTRPRRWAKASELGAMLLRTRGAAVALDRVRNPYNVGAILRTAAFFGIEGALLGAIAPHPALAPDAVRVAEGGVEHLTLARTTDLAETLGRLRGLGVRVVGADGRATSSAFHVPFTRPLVLVLGHEREGISERVRMQCDDVVAIQGSGAIESLNVAVAAGLLIARAAGSSA